MMKNVISQFNNKSVRHLYHKFALHFVGKFFLKQKCSSQNWKRKKLYVVLILSHFDKVAFASPGKAFTVNALLSMYKRGGDRVGDTTFQTSSSVSPFHWATFEINIESAYNKIYFFPQMIVNVLFFLPKYVRIGWSAGSTDSYARIYRNFNFNLAVTP